MPPPPPAPAPTVITELLETLKQGSTNQVVVPGAKYTVDVPPQPAIGIRVPGIFAQAAAITNKLKKEEIKYFFHFTSFAKVAWQYVAVMQL
jgi:hypothetical protein